MRNPRPERRPHESFQIDPGELDELLARKQAEADHRLAVELSDRTARMRFFESLGEHMSHVTDLPELGGEILPSLCLELGARHAALAVVNDDQFLEVVASTEMPPTPHQLDWLEEAFIAGEKLYTDGEPALRHAMGNAELPAGVPLLAVPLTRHDGHPLGAIYLEGALRPDRESWLPELFDLIARALEDCQHYGRIERLIGDVALAIGTAHEAGDPECEGHLQHVGGLAQRIAEAMGLGATERKHVALTAVLHDMTPEDVRGAFNVMQRAEWTRRQWDALMAHPFVGGLYPSPLANFQRAVDGLRHMRARYDGRGNATAVAGLAIPLPVRVVAVAEAFEKLTVPRARRSPIDVMAAVAELRRHAGTLYDPVAVEALASLYAVQELELRIAATDE